MREEPPLLLPIFRSAAQARILAEVFLSDVPMSLAEIANRAEVPYPTVHREVGRLLAAGLLREARVGNTRLTQPNEFSPFHTPLRELVELAFGPVPLLRAELAMVSGVSASAIFGSWAHRAVGQPGPPPSDIDVLVLGDPDPADVYEACARVGGILHRPVNPTILSQSEWDAGSPFIDDVRANGILALTGQVLGGSDE